MSEWPFCRLVLVDIDWLADMGQEDNLLGRRASDNSALLAAVARIEQEVKDGFQNTTYRLDAINGRVTKNEGRIRSLEDTRTMSEGMAQQAAKAAIDAAMEAERNVKFLSAMMVLVGTCVTLANKFL